MKRLIWHGFSAGVIAFGTGIAALQEWPTRLQWLILSVGALAAAVKGVNGYLEPPGGGNTP